MQLQMNQVWGYSNSSEYAILCSENNQLFYASINHSDLYYFECRERWLTMIDEFIIFYYIQMARQTLSSVRKCKWWLLINATALQNINVLNFQNLEIIICIFFGWNCRFACNLISSALPQCDQSDKLTFFEAMRLLVTLLTKFVFLTLLSL